MFLFDQGSIELSDEERNERDVRLDRNFEEQSMKPKIILG